MTGEQERRLEYENSQDTVKKSVLEKAEEIVQSSLQKRRNGKRPMIVVLYHRKRGRNGIKIIKEGEVTLEPYGGARNTWEEKDL